MNEQKKMVISKKKLISIVTVLCLCCTSFGAMIVSGSPTYTLTSIVEAGSLNSESAYIIFQNQGNIYLKNGSTGSIDYQSTNATAVIQEAINTLESGQILIRSGTYNLVTNINVKSNIIIKGEFRDSTILSTLSNTLSIIDIRNADNVAISDLTLTGYTAIRIYADNTDRSNFTLYNIIARDSVCPQTAFAIVPQGCVISNITMKYCEAINWGSHGFLNIATVEPTISGIRDIIYDHCKAINCGKYARENDWIVGFDPNEGCSLYRATYIDCEASGSWESGFHLESAGEMRDIRLIDCIARSNGQDKPGIVYGVGFWITSNMTLTGCKSFDNRYGFRIQGTIGNEGDILLENCIDNGSSVGFVVQDYHGNLVINDCISLYSKSYGFHAFASSGIHTNNLQIYGAMESYIQNAFGDIAYPIFDCTFNVYIKGPASDYCAMLVGHNNTFSGELRSNSNNSLGMINCQDTEINNLIIESNGVRGIWLTNSSSKNVIFFNVLIINHDASNALSQGILNQNPTNISICSNVYGIGYITTEFVGGVDLIT